MTRNSLTPTEKRTFLLTLIFGVLLFLGMDSPGNVMVRTFIPTFRPILDWVEYWVVNILVFFLLQLVSGLWIISTGDVPFSFRSKAFYKELMNIGFYWGVIMFIVISLAFYEDINVISISLTGTCFYMTFLLIFELMVWFLGKISASRIRPFLEYIKHNTITISRIQSTITDKFPSMPEIRFSVLIFVGYILGSYLINVQLLNPLLYFCKVPEFFYLIKILTITSLWVILSQLFALKKQSSVKTRQLFFHTLIIFLILQQVSIRGEYITFWLPYDNIPFDNLFIFLEAFWLWCVLEIPVAASSIFIGIYLKKWVKNHKENEVQWLLFNS